MTRSFLSTRRGKLTLALLCAVAFLDFVDAPIVNVALPTIRQARISRWLSRIPVGGSFISDLLPGMVVMSLGFGPVFVGVTTAANAGVPPDKAGLAAALVNASQQLGGALGLAIFTALATSETRHRLAAHAAPAHALNSGLQRALLASAVFVLAAAIIAVRATNTRGDAGLDAVALSAPGSQPEPA